MARDDEHVVGEVGGMQANRDDQTTLLRGDRVDLEPVRRIVWLGVMTIGAAFEIIVKAIAIFGEAVDIGRETIVSDERLRWNYESGDDGVECWGVNKIGRDVLWSEIHESIIDVKERGGGSHELRGVVARVIASR